MGKREEFRKCKRIGRRVQRKIKCGSKITGKRKSEERNKKESKSRKV